MTAAITTTRMEGLDFVGTRVFDAPRSLVFRAFSECQSLARWFGPAGWTLPVCEMDFREGGTWFYCMRPAEGEDACGKTTYLEIVEPVRIIHSDEFADRDGNVSAGMPRMLVTITFTDVDGRTQLESRTRFASAEDLKTVAAMGMEEGLRECWDRLDDHLARSAS
jgi:uncharacterized protein YndB with AHSA1/START domain